MKLLTLWLHLLAAVVWLGGLLFQSHILFPILAKRGPTDALASAVRRFRRVAWTALVVLVLTGLHNLTRLPPVATWSPSGLAPLLALKLFLVVVVLMLSAHRDFGLAARLLRELAAGTSTHRIVRTIVRVDRVVLLLGVILLYLGLAVSRGGIS
ncbi:MAG: CopD family protein [Candidatus Rokubacteria bacterium]|nr:CopD family protein [Candidatus Rokubacteria bacterium]